MKWKIGFGLAAGALALGFFVIREKFSLQARLADTLAQASHARAQGQLENSRQAGGMDRSQLPLSQVILFSSGVGYFQRQGPVEGNARIDLRFSAGDVNDLLKSMILEDGKGTKISAISYDGQDPVEKTLRSFALDLTTNPTLGQLLQQARGEKIEITLTSGGNTVSGTILGMESQMQPSGKDTQVEVHQLNLVGADGIRGVKLSDIQRMKFMNPTLNEELRRALEVVAASHDQMKKMVSLQFKGEGKREVKVGYVAENPIWKSSYRLTLLGNGKGRLQGFAAVENTTDEDWKDVRMVLVSGRPISFQMDLYPPLFVPRPTVEPEKYAMLRPPTYNGAITAGNNPMMPTTMAPTFPPGFGQLGGLGGQFGGFGGGQMGNSGYVNYGNDNRFINPSNRYQGNQIGQNFINLNAPPAPPGQNPNADNALQQQQLAGIQNNDALRNNRLSYQDLQNRKQNQKEINDANMKAAAQKGQKIAANHDRQLEAEAADEAGESFQYLVDEKISLPRQKSALIQILNEEIDVTPFSLYNESVHAKFPLMGLRVKNSTKHPLPQGPVTVFENNAYAGDARLSDLQPDEERFISYAVDLSMEVKTEVKQSVGPEIRVQYLGDRAQAGYSSRQTKFYTIRNRGKSDRVAVVEHPIRQEWKLVGDAKTLEQSRDLYRFQVPAPSQKTVTFDVPEEQPRVEALPLTSILDSKRAILASHPSHLGVEFQLFTQVKPVELKSISINKGMVSVSTDSHESRSYKMISRSELDRKIILEHVVRPDWKLDDATLKPVEGATTLYRFPLELPKGKSVEKEIAESKSQVVVEKISTMEEGRIKGYLLQPVVKPAVKAALQRTLDVKAALHETKRKLTEQEKELKSISEDQTRLRANLQNVPSTSAAYKRYLDKFDKQETQIELLQDGIRKLQMEEKKQQTEVDDVLGGISAE